jgi:hypothetical protein
MKPTFWLFVSVICFAIGFTETNNIPSYLGKPLGAVFFGIYWIGVFLRGEIAKYNEDVRAKIAELPAEYRERALDPKTHTPDHPGTPTQGPVPDIMS